MAGLPGRLAKTLLLIIVLMLLLGCSSTRGIMSAENLRAALDECHELRLWVLVYQRPDRSVMDVRCIPDPDQVNEYVTLRPKLSMKMIRPFFESQPIPKGYYEQQYEQR